MRERILLKLLTPFNAVVARQLAHPSGWLGRTVMTRALNRGNRELITSTLDCLALSAETRLLDVGFGGGLALQLARQKGVMQLHGVDPSLAALERLKQTSSTWLRGAKLTLAQGVVERLPFDVGAVDAIISTNTLYFWPNLVAPFYELRRVLGLKGQLALGFSSSQKLRSFAAITQHGFRYYENDVLLDQARRAGLHAVRLIELHGRDTTGDFVLLATG
jgi:arsenite methyltransferase